MLSQFYLTLTRGDEELPDDEPMTFADLNAARAEAITSIREMASEALYAGSSFDYDGINITDLNGVIVLRVLTSEVLAGWIK